MLRCIIIDDEQFSVDALLKYIKLTERIEVVQIYLDSQDALRNAGKFDNIDILFLDVHMPNLSGIELARVYRKKVKTIIFTTACSFYTLNADEVDAVLLKPFTYAKFLETIHSLFSAEQIKDNQGFVSEKDYFLVKNKDEDFKVVVIAFRDVIYIESWHNYIKIHLVDKRIITAHLTITDIAHLLNYREDFVQFHRNYILSIHQILHIHGQIITLKNNLDFPVGNEYSEQLSRFLSANS